jgi:hypothetical protein
LVRKGAQNGLRFDSHVGTVLCVAFAYTKFVGDYFIRLAELDRPNDREFTGRNAGCRRRFSRAPPLPTSHKQEVNRHISSPRQNKAHRLNCNVKSQRYWDVTSCAKRNGGPLALSA